MSGIPDSKNWWEMTADELIAAGHKPVHIQSSPDEGWVEVPAPQIEDE